ncbi:MAG: hypothetical protein U0531_04380 [Dehalococcoidia bacterium]
MRSTPTCSGRCAAAAATSGVLTSLELRLEPAGAILGGGVFYPATDGARLIRAAAAYPPRRRTVTTMVMVMRAPPCRSSRRQVGDVVALVAFCYVGDLAEGERVVAPLRTPAAPVVNMVGPMPYPGMFGLTADLALPGRRLAVQSLYLNEVDDAVADTIMAHTRDGWRRRLAWRSCECWVGRWRACRQRRQRSAIGTSRSCCRRLRSGMTRPRTGGSRRGRRTSSPRCGHERRGVRELPAG